METTRERWLFRGFLALLLWAPIPLGSNRPLAWAFLEVGLLSLFVLWLLWRWFHPNANGSFIEEQRPAILFFVMATLFPLWQLLPMPEPLLGLISPETVRIRHFAGVVDAGGPITLDAHATWTVWLKGVAYLLAFWLTLVLVKSRKRLLHLALVLVGSGVFQALYGLITMDPQAEQPIHGTFVNTNHMAGLLELTLPVAIGLMIAWTDEKDSRRTWWLAFQDWLNFISGRKGVVSGLVVTMLLALFMTRSRSGNACLFFSLLSMVGLSTFRKHRSHREKRLLIPLLLIAFLAGGWIGLGHLMGRIMNTDLQREGRWAAAVSTLEMVGDHPLFGIGAGSFAYRFPHYQTRLNAGAFVDHAHNDHLEFLANRGLVGYGLLAAGLILCWWRILRGYLRRKDPFARGLLFASLSATLSLTLHGLFDFNFQIPANALYFTVVLAMGLRAVSVAAGGGDITWEDSSGHSRSRRKRGYGTYRPGALS